MMMSSRGPLLNLYRVPLLLLLIAQSARGHEHFRNADGSIAVGTDGSLVQERAQSAEQVTAAADPSPSPCEDEELAIKDKDKEIKRLSDLKKELDEEVARYKTKWQDAVAANEKMKDDNQKALLAEKKKLEKEEEESRECRTKLDEQEDKLKDANNQGSEDKKEAIRQAKIARQGLITLNEMKENLSRVTALLYASLLKVADSAKKSLDLVGTKAGIQSSGDKDAADDAALDAGSDECCAKKDESSGSGSTPAPPGSTPAPPGSTPAPPGSTPAPTPAPTLSD